MHYEEEFFFSIFSGVKQAKDLPNYFFKKVLDQRYRDRQENSLISPCKSQ